MLAAPTMRGELVAQPLRERRRGAAGRDGDRDRPVAVHRGQDERAELGHVGDVAEHRRAPPRPRTRARFSAVSSVAATTRKQPSRSQARSDARATSRRAHATLVSLGATTVTRAPQSSSPRLLVRDRPPPTTRQLRPAGRGTRCSTASPPLDPDGVERARPARSRRTDSSSPSTPSVRRNAAGPRRLHRTCLERLALQRRERLGHLAASSRQLAAARQPAVELQRRLLALGPVERADAAGLQPELEQLLERLARRRPRPRRRRPRRRGRRAGRAAPRPAPSRAPPAPRRARPRPPRRAS